MSRNAEKEKREQWMRWEMQEFPDAKQEVLQFIIDLTCQAAVTGLGAEVIRSTFRAGYCWHFAQLLKATFRRGQACWTAPYGHFVWMDDNGVPYDVEGVHTGECEYYIPESYLGEHVHDFLHIPGDGAPPATKEQVLAIIRRYEDDNGLPRKEIQFYNCEEEAPLTGPEPEEYAFKADVEVPIFAHDVSEAVRIFEASCENSYARNVKSITANGVPMAKTKSRSTNETIWFRPGCPYGNTGCPDDPMRTIAENCLSQPCLIDGYQKECPRSKDCPYAHEAKRDISEKE